MTLIAISTAEGDTSMVDTRKQRDPAAGGEAEAEAFRLIAVGDALVSQSVTASLAPECSGVGRLLTGADAAFVNLEGVVRNKGEGTPQAESGGTWVTIQPAHARELAELGFNLFNTAHNHTLDWGQDGLLAMLSHLNRSGVTHAGAGENLAAARQPAYLDTPKGRVALIAVAVSFNNWNRAGHSRPDCRGRPGLSGVRLQTTLQVTAEEFTALERLNSELQLDAKTLLREKLGFLPPAAEGTLQFGQYNVRRGATRALLQELHPGDVREVLQSVSEARRQADRVMFSVHNHELGDGRLEVPPVWLKEFSRQVLDAGADAILGHGPHILQGIELHEGKPILYSLGNFIFENETQQVQPADLYEAQALRPEHGPADVFDKRAERGGFAAHRHYWDSVVAVLDWQGKQLTELQLHPVTLGFGEPRSRRGSPVLASGAEARRIIADLAALSAPLGSSLEWHEAGYGVLRIT